LTELLGATSLRPFEEDPDATLLAGSGLRSLGHHVACSPGRRRLGDGHRGIQDDHDPGGRSTSAAGWYARARAVQLPLKAGLDQARREQLLAQEAKARGVSFEALIRQEIDAKLSDPTDADVQKFAAENKDRLGGTVEQVKPQIVSFLKDQRKQERRAALVAGLKTKYKTTVALKAPVWVATAGDRRGRRREGAGDDPPVHRLSAASAGRPATLDGS
jgi:hypothetical protein